MKERRNNEREQLLFNETLEKNIHGCLQNKLIGKIPHSYQSKTFENPNIADIKSIITEHPENSHKSSKTIIQA